jgi:hypothetical protein
MESTNANEMGANEMGANEMGANEMGATNEIERLMSSFKEKMDTHPELSTVWYNYLKIQNEKIKALISQGDSVINRMNNMPDISIKSIILYNTFTSLYS